jgi:hypothetical protein
VNTPPYGRMLSGIRGLRLHITSMAAKFKYDDHNPKNTAPRSPNAWKAAEPAGTTPQPRSNADASTKSANGDPATNRGAGITSRQNIAPEHT